MCSVPTGMMADVAMTSPTRLMASASSMTRCSPRRLMASASSVTSPTSYMASASSMFGGLMRLTGTAPQTSILNSMPSAYEPMQTDTDALSGDRVGFFPY